MLKALIVMTEFFSNPLNTFLIGLGIAVALAIYVWFGGVINRRKLRREVNGLKEQLHRQMTIVDKGNEKVLAELEALKKQNENLRITVATLKGKPGRAELQLLQVYEQALRLMQKRAPGFAPAWEDALAEVQRAADQVDTGLVAMVRKALRLPTSTPTREAIEAGEPDSTDSKTKSEPGQL